MSESVECCGILTWSYLKRKMVSLILVLFLSISKCVIFFLDYASRELKTVVNEKPTNFDVGTQTGDSQDVMGLITHHFGALHEENYIRNIVERHRWNKMNSELVFIRGQIQCQSDSFNLFKDEIKELKDNVTNLKHLIMFSNNHHKPIPLTVCSDDRSFIPPAPPLPPPGFISTNSGNCGFRADQPLRKSRIFEENFPPRPLITVESLKEVKLKKVLSPKTLKDEPEEKDMFPTRVKNLRKIPNDIFKKRPRTADSANIKLKTNMTISSPRPLTSNS